METTLEPMSLDKKVAASWEPFIQQLALKKKAQHGLWSTYQINNEFSGVITVSPHEDRDGAVSVLVNLHLRWDRLEKIHQKLLRNKSGNFTKTIVTPLASLLPNEDRMFWYIRLSSNEPMSMNHVAATLEKYGFKHLRETANVDYIVDRYQAALTKEHHNPLLNLGVKWPLILNLTGRDKAAKDFVLAHMKELNERGSSQFDSYQSWYAPRLLSFFETGEIPTRNADLPPCENLSPSNVVKSVGTKEPRRTPINSFRFVFDQFWKRHANSILSRFNPIDSLQPGFEYELRNDGSSDAICKIFFTIRWLQLEEIVSHYYTDIDNAATIRIECSHLLGFALPSVCDCSSETSIEEYLLSIFDLLNKNMSFSSLCDTGDLVNLMITLQQEAKTPWAFNNVGVRLPIALLLAGRTEEALQWIANQGRCEPEFLYPAFTYYRDQFLPRISDLIKSRSD